MSNLQFIWVIQSSIDLNIIGCFMKKEDAEKFIHQHELKCILTQFPVDSSVYDWVIQHDFWQPKFDSQKTARFIGAFSSAYLQHEHFK